MKLATALLVHSGQYFAENYQTYANKITWDVFDPSHTDVIVAQEEYRVTQFAFFHSYFLYLNYVFRLLSPILEIRKEYYLYSKTVKVKLTTLTLSLSTFN